MAQRLETIIAINAQVGNGFSEIGSTLTQLGAQVDQISNKLINFGKSSLKTYEDYEKNMSEARVALATKYGEDTKELSDVMTQLDTQARQWASTTIFHTDDVGNAITEAARAGWDYAQIMQGIPAAMQLAQAGSIDLSDAVYYITEAAKAGGIEFENLSEFIDMWAYTANSSNGTIESFGDSMLKLGSVMKFAKTREELLSLIAVMHDTGTEGSTAATLLRTAMMSIAAPSGVASTVLEQLGFTEEDIKELGIIEDGTKKEALALLAEHGFDAYDNQGQLKPILQIFSELRAALIDITGSEQGFENLVASVSELEGVDSMEIDDIAASVSTLTGMDYTRNQTALGVLGVIFGKRGITGALNIMNMMERAEELQGELLSGNAIGYGSFAADTMMDTLYGSVETWQSKVENLELRTGEALSKQVRPILETVGGIVDSIAELDEGTFNAIVAGLEVIAGAGPGLLLAGGAFRLIGYALTPAGGIGMGLIALAAAANAIDKLEQADYASKFGDLELDTAGIQNYVQQISADFKQAYSNVDEFTRALGAAVEQYTTASSSFKSSLIQDMLTDVDVSEGTPEYEKLSALGESMIQAVKDGIDTNYGATTESIANSFSGGEGVDAITNPIWAQIMAVMEQGYAQELARAENLGQQLRDAMTKAFKDGHLTSKELSDIQSVNDELNEAVAQQQDREHYLERQRIMRQAQTLGLDAIRESSEIVEAERDAEREALLSSQDAARYDLGAWYDKAIENGWMVPNTDGTFGEHAATEGDKTAALAALEETQSDELYRWSAGFSDYLIGLWSEGITSSELGDAWESLRALGLDFRQAGGYVTPYAAQRYNAAVNADDSWQAQQYLGEMIDALGGFGVLQDYVDYFNRHDNPEMAKNYQLLMDMYSALNGGGNVFAEAGTMGTSDYSDTRGTYEQIAALLRGRGVMVDGSQMTPENLAEYMLARQDMGEEPDWWGYLGEETFLELNTIAGSLGTNISDMIANAVPIDDMRQAINREKLDAMIDELDQVNQEITETRDRLNEKGDWKDWWYTFTNQGVDDEIQLEKLESKRADLEAEITTLSSELGPVNVGVETTGGAESMNAEIANMQTVANMGVRVPVFTQGSPWPTMGLRRFASGGRTTEAAIFGEVPGEAEWAIPEEHSERTAALLDATRAASGFTWNEIINRFGGLNSNTGHTPSTLIYSPTIYAQDANGVDEKLKADKERMQKWYDEKMMKDEAEVYT